MSNDFESQGSEPQSSRDDVLVDRVVDGDASAADWAELELFAERDHQIWQRLGHAMHVEWQMHHALNEAVAVADLVELPQTAVEPAAKVAVGVSTDRPASDVLRSGNGRATSRWVFAAGWAAAVVFAVLWFVEAGALPQTANNADGFVADGSTDLEESIGTDSRVTTTVADRDIADRDITDRDDQSPATWEQLFDDAYNAYVSVGRDNDRIFEMPSVVVDATPTGSGDELEILLLRRTIERRIVDKAYSPAVDELGRQQLVPLPASHFASGEAM